MTKRDYERYDALYDRRAELEDMITDVEHIMTYGIVQSDPDRLAHYEEELHSLRSDLDRTEQELDRLAEAMERIERADFERMTA